MPNREMGVGGLIRGAPGPVIGIVGCALPPWIVMLQDWALA